MFLKYLIDIISGNLLPAYTCGDIITEIDFSDINRYAFSNLPYLNVPDKMEHTEFIKMLDTMCS
jgi:hypothetical protein